MGETVAGVGAGVGLVVVVGVDEALAAEAGVVLPEAAAVEPPEDEVEDGGEAEEEGEAGGG